MDNDALLHLFIDKHGEPYLALIPQHPFEAFAQLHPFKMPDRWWRYLRRVYEDTFLARREARSQLGGLLEKLEKALEGYGPKGAWLGAIEKCSSVGALLTMQIEAFGSRKYHIDTHSPDFWFSLAQVIRDEFSGESGGDDWLSFPMTDEALNNQVRYYSARTAWGYIALKTYLCLKETDPEYFKLRFPAEAEQVLENLKTLPSVEAMKEILIFDLSNRPLEKTEILPIPPPPEPSNAPGRLVVQFSSMAAAVRYYLCGPEKGFVLSIDGRKPAEPMRVRFIPGENELNKVVEYIPQAP